MNLSTAVEQGRKRLQGQDSWKGGGSSVIDRKLMKPCLVSRRRCISASVADPGSDNSPKRREGHFGMPGSVKGRDNIVKSGWREPKQSRG